MKLLSRIEEIVLLSIWKLGPHAYGLTIYREVVRATRKDWLVGAIYAPLSRLHKNGYIRIKSGESAPERGGKRRIYYQLTPRGRAALAEIQEMNAHIWRDIPFLKGEKTS